MDRRKHDDTVFKENDILQAKHKELENQNLNNKEIKKQIEHERETGRQESVEMRDGDDNSKANTMMIKTNGDDRLAESAASIDQAMQEIPVEVGHDPNKAE